MGRGALIGRRDLGRTDRRPRQRRPATRSTPHDVDFTPWMVAAGIVATALAQILLKQSSLHGVMSGPWLGFVGIAAGAYGLSFLLYALILKTYALNKIYPAMTVGQIVIVTIYGLAIGEVIDTRHAVGLVFGAIAIYLILG